ncbi:MAG: anaerobic ribonucleoside-triphosphate reductase activating protein [Bacteroidales bacterium]|nr:anaerobic ribonucleoside-triphosphate reductase activating protein [Bacteroidales bacterium]
MHIYVLKIVESTTVDGPGFRNSVYCAGCENKCPGCHNPQSWDMMAGTPMLVEDIATKLLDDDLCNVSFSGGDPMFQAKGFAQLARIIKAKSNKTIWCYSGYTLEEILSDPDKKDLLANVDVLVDGRYVEALRDTDLLFRGSSNQRILDAQMSLKTGKPVEFNYNPFPNLS